MTMSVLYLVLAVGAVIALWAAAVLVIVVPALVVVTGIDVVTARRQR